MLGSANYATARTSLGPNVLIYKGHENIGLTSKIIIDKLYSAINFTLCCDSLPRYTHGRCPGYLIRIWERWRGSVITFIR